ncbi:alpha/beta hydrolase [Chishuiella changwenlii]|uniref:Alpha/beta hydrolase n=1 Tax=Chishuiella changwenlii TaxID=1434701 RepID=A0ABQ1TBD0_9FLAO|nr:alpha/beta hydrolase [Chishuiella changwenlii]GGE89266.1 alpha/beta hydrolase [Chishuiella changwenlii]
MQQKNIHSLIDVNGKQLYVELQYNYPNKPTIVFLHDSLGCVQLWRDFPQKLAEATQNNVLVYDRLGYGKSEPMLTHERPVDYLELEADVLNELLTILEINNVILFGHSDGGSIALISASKYPEKMKALICEAGHIFVEDVTLKGIYKAMEAYKTSNLPERLAKYHNDKVEAIFRSWTETWTRSDYRDWNIEYFLPQITCPLLFVQGELDEYGTLEQVEKTISQINGKAEKYIIKNVGHTPHKEAPELTFNAVKEFIKNI